jgi:hypothetical protein
MSVLPELRVAVRGLVRDRAYATLGRLSIAFGIATNTIIFSLVDGELLRPLRYSEPSRLLDVSEVVSELAKTYPKLPVRAAAGYLPARRATIESPLRALRYE